MNIVINEGITKPHIRTLPICETPPVQMYLHHTLPLSMVLVHDIKYMYKHYTQVYYDPTWEEQAGFLFDFDIPFINHTVLLTQKFHKKTIAIPRDQIIEQMIHWIDNEYYILFYADESMLPQTLMHRHTQQVVHQTFYYGYDKTNSIFKMLNYDNHRIFRTIDIHFDDFIKSLYFDRETGALSHHTYLNVELLKVNVPFVKKNYTDDLVITSIYYDLIDYLECKRGRFDLFEDNHIKGRDMMYGNLLQFFKGEFQTIYRLQSVVGFHQHKMAMKYRLDYLESKQLIGSEVAESFLAVCKHAEVIKNLYVKSTITQNESSLAAIIGKLAEVKVMEEKILLQVLSQLPKP